MKMKYLGIISSSVCVSAIVLSAVVILPARVFAQPASSHLAAQDSAATSPTPTSGPANSDLGTVPVDTIFLKTQQPEKIQELLDLYQAEVEQYRTLEREFQVNKAQYQKLGTLQSLEQAVVSTQKVMSSRDQVLITYLELLHASLEETPGVEVTLKSANLKDMEAKIQSLKDHKVKVDATTDREGIAARVAEFKPISTTIQPTAYTVISLIVTGKLQAVYDKSVLLYADIKKYHVDHPTTALRQGERERAYTEVDKSVTTLAAQLDAIRVATKNGQSTTTPSSNSMENLGMTYSGTALLLSYLRELIVELT